MRTSSYIFLMGGVIAVLLLAGCAQPQTAVPATPTATQTSVAAVPAASPASADTITVRDSPLGTILTDASGRTLYYFTADVASAGKSACNAAGNCSTNWPAFSAAPVVSAPLSPSGFSSITRADGTNQVTYHGWPLYYFAKDAKPGDTNGEGVINRWHVVRPDYSVWIATTPALGSFLTDASGRTLYFFSKDTTGTSACTGACITNWPAFDAGTMTLPPSLKSSDFAPVVRADGMKQSAFMGRPLYYFAKDTKPGDTNGEGVINSWAVANISGVMPVGTTVPTPVPTTAATLSSSGGGGY